MGCKDRKSKRPSWLAPSSTLLVVTMLLTFLTVSTPQSCPTAWPLTSFQESYPRERGRKLSKQKPELISHDLWPVLFVQEEGAVSIQDQETTQNSTQHEAGPTEDILETTCPCLTLSRPLSKTNLHSTALKLPTLL